MGTLSPCLGDPAEDSGRASGTGVSPQGAGPGWGLKSYLCFSSPVSDFFLPQRETQKQIVRMRGQHEAILITTQRKDRGLHTTEQPLTPTLTYRDDTAQGM